MMNYSDYDSDGYSSNDDVDYVPSDDNLSEDDLAQCEKEEPLNENDDVPHHDIFSKKKKKKNNTSMRKMTKSTEEGEGEDGRTEDAAKETAHDESSQKKKTDDLWASFLSDVGSRPKDETPASQSSSTQKVSSSCVEPKASAPAKVTITQVFDFAGEEVRVNKEVSADSKEAKNYLKSQNTQEDENGVEEQSSSPRIQDDPGPSAKRPAGMSSLLNRIGGKKQKMSTLEKSKMDWDAFKSEEGISEELAIHNRGRDGYVERKNFLERVDHRQFEREKAVRLSNMKQ
ncbi:craniofacial development protein 1 [Genypterus blacodes]|uniref:craniofacial development protein 1 n=1 Tax=Genypterus blacodes TaxID=154954 RepID=UPI003F76579A